MELPDPIRPLDQNMTAIDMNRLSSVKVLDPYLLHLIFSDAHKKTVDLRPFLGRGITSDLLEYENFKRVNIEPGGGLEWYNGFDLCPNTLRDLSSKNNK